MVVKHINSSPSDNSLVFLAQSPRGTMLYDYTKELFLVVDGYTDLGSHRCVYDKSTVRKSYSLHKAFYMLYPEEMSNDD